MAGFAGFDGADVVAENVTVRGTLAVTDDVTLIGDQVVDDLEVGGTLDVTGATTVDDVHATGDLELDGALNHDGTTVGFYGVTPATRPTAFTQTYATATKTHAGMTSADVDTTGAALTSYGFTEAQANAIVAAINALRADVINVKGVVNSIIDDGQALGHLQ